ncbi:MAG: menaquinone biosynthesis protein [Planctomycetes bacterium]|nr:menaquinone biosynthesis protein [Planctomycetota bacterium]
MNALRLGYVRFLNTSPLVEGLDVLAGLEPQPAVPSNLAPMLQNGKVDLALCSVIDAARSAIPLTLLTCGMIGCDGPTLTVRLFSSVPWDKVTHLHADTDSHTSIALAQVILAERFNVRPSIVPFHARERFAADGSIPAGPLDHAWPPTVLLIGDKVITDPPPKDRYPHQLDLGQAWKDLTGLPFVYACWMCRSADMETPESATRIHHAADLLDRQRRRNLARLDWLVESRASQHRWPIDIAREYLGTLLRYQITEREMHAAQRFIDLASALHIVPTCALKWSTASPIRA